MLKEFERNCIASQISAIIRVIKVNKLRCYGYVMRSEDDYVIKKALRMKMIGKERRLSDPSCVEGRLTGDHLVR